ncbi:MAG: patatin-like phospholipase family protein [Clostridia bacterium]|nr:patatin-like phospholipase family protein [Clostridia bacterium]
MPERRIKIKPFSRKKPLLKDLPEGYTPNQQKTAFVLSGGGSRGAYQIGVWKALKELGIHIDIAVGTSIGALNAAAVTQDTYEAAEALWEQLETDMVFDYAHVFENKGVKFTTIKDILRQNLIEEDIRSSNIDFGIVTVKFPSMEPLYLWKEDIPQGEMIDYILASSACFPAVTPYEIHDERFLDGAFYDYMPISLALERGAGKIIAVNLDAAGKVREEDMLLAKDRLTIVESHWDLGAFIIFDKENARHIMRLGYLDGLKAFEILDGFRYTFGKGQMDLRTLKTAEYTAFAFGLDPEIVYTQETFMAKLKKSILSYNKSQDRELAEARRHLKEFSLIKIERTIENIRTLGKRAAILFLVDLINKQSSLPAPSEKALKEPPAVLQKALERIFQKDVNAATWIIKNGML